MEVVTGSDISSFELIHSGLVSTLLLYLTATYTVKDDTSGSTTRASATGSGKSASSSSDKNPGSISDITDGPSQQQLMLPGTSLVNGGSSSIGGGFGASLDAAVLANIVKTPRDERLRNFLHVFLGCSVRTSRKLNILYGDFLIESYGRTVYISIIFFSLTLCITFFL